MLVNGNLTEHQPKFLTKYMNNSYYDYYPEWYADVGQKIVQTMVVNAFMPYVGVVTAFAVPKVLRFIDQRGNQDVYETHKTSMSGFKKLYSGGDYVIHFKYSNILNIVYITCMYGIGMPMLFPVSAFNFISQYICERIVVAYGMKLPPALDDKLSKNALQMLKFAPLIMLFNGYWMTSNP